MQNFKVGIVGCGRIAVRHADILNSGQLHGIELVCVCDTDLDKAELFAKKYSVTPYDQIETMMKNHELDLVSVLTESGNHHDNVMLLSGYGSHVVVEKPMALRVSDANTMVEAFKNSQNRLFVVKQNRFNKPVAFLKGALQKNELGSLLMATARVRWCRDQSYYDQADWRGTWRMDGGVLANQAIHHVDLLQWLAGDIRSVFAKSATYLANIEAEDTLLAILQFKNGALGSIEATTAARPKNLEGSISILGSLGSAEIGGFAANKLLHFNAQGNQSNKNVDLEDYASNPPDVYGYGHRNFYEHIFECLKYEKKSMLEGEEGLKSLKIVNAIYQSIETGTEIIMNETSFESRLGNCLEPFGVNK